ncbi:MAG: YbjN domain-containing protein [Geminicoccaceae bacterium]
MSTRNRLCATLLLLLAGLFSVPVNQAFAERLVDASDPVVLRDIIARYGKAFLMVDSHGDPLIEGRIDGQQFRVHFYDCVNGGDCKMLAFRRSSVRPDLTLEHINSWNHERLFGVATLDAAGTSTIGLDVNLAHGVSQANFTETVETWRGLLSDFASFASDETG